MRINMKKCDICKVEYRDDKPKHWSDCIDKITLDFKNHAGIQVMIEKDDKEEISCSAHYEATCEYGGLGRRGLPIPLTKGQKQIVSNFIEQVIMPQVKEHEGV